MFEETVIKLLKGTFICRVAYLDEFSFLENETNRRKVDAYLNQIGKCLSSTAHGEAYYASNTKINSNERAEIKNLFKEIKYTIRPMLNFLILMLQAQHADRIMSTGDVIDFPKTLLYISENPHLGEMLRGFPTMGKEFASSDASLRALLDRLLQQMVKMEYLIPDRQGDRFIVTGKIDYFYEIVDFLAENEQAIREAEDQESGGEGGETGWLF